MTSYPDRLSPLSTDPRDPLRSHEQVSIASGVQIASAPRVNLGWGSTIARVGPNTGDPFFVGVPHCGAFAGVQSEEDQGLTNDLIDPMMWMMCRDMLYKNGSHCCSGGHSRNAAYPVVRSSFSSGRSVHIARMPHPCGMTSLSSLSISQRSGWAGRNNVNEAVSSELGLVVVVWRELGSLWLLGLLVVLGLLDVVWRGLESLGLLVSLGLSVYLVPDSVVSI